MGCSFSSWKAKQTFDCVRVIHINGYVEDFDAPVNAGQVTGKPPKHVLCSSAQLLSLTPRPLRTDDELEPGRLYFLLPPAVFQTDSSPVDLASLLARLTALARRGGWKAAPAEQPRAPGKSGPLGGFPRGYLATTRAWRPELDPIEERSMGRSMHDSSRNSSFNAS